MCSWKYPTGQDKKLITRDNHSSFWKRVIWQLWLMTGREANDPSLNHFDVLEYSYYNFESQSGTCHAFKLMNPRRFVKESEFFNCSLVWHIGFYINHLRFILIYTISIVFKCSSGLNVLFLFSRIFSLISKKVQMYLDQLSSSAWLGTKIALSVRCPKNYLNVIIYLFRGHRLVDIYMHVTSHPTYQQPSTVEY